MKRRRLPAVAGLVLTIGTIGLTSAPAAQATDATWTGQAAFATPNWSAGANWSGGSAPSGTVGTLSFPALTGCDSTLDTCYSGDNYNGVFDDLGAVNANELTIDNNQPYYILPADNTDTITLAGNSQVPNVGLSTTPTGSGFAFSTLGVPVILGNDQTWNLTGGSIGFGLLNVPDISGSHALTLNLTGNFQLYSTVVDAGALTINGSGGLYLIPDSNGDPGVLPAAGVTLPDGTSTSQPSLNVDVPGTTSGPIDASAGVNYGNQVSVGAGSLPEASLAVTGDVNLGPGTALGFSIDGNDTGMGVDSSDMTVDGNVSLDGARMGMSQGSIDTNTDNCSSLTPGNTYTLITTSGGTISGTMHYWDGTGYDSSVDEGETSATPTPFGQNCQNGTPAEAFINYGSTSITETIAAAPTSTAVPTISGTAAVGQTLTASNGSWSAYPAPSYAHQWMACKSGGCSAISGATGSTFAVTSAQEGDTIEVQVTATNSLGNASATSSATGTVPTPTTTTPTTTTPTTTTPAPTLPTSQQVSSALAGIGHPTGSKPIAALLKTHSYTTSLTAPSAGAVGVTWTTVVTTGTGKHKKHRTVTVATGSGTANGAGKISITIHLTSAGRALLKRRPHNLHITATEKFQPAGGSWTTIVKHFTL